MRFRDYVDLVARTREGNDFYMCANNHALAEGELSPLLRDCAPSR